MPRMQPEAYPSPPSLGRLLWGRRGDRALLLVALLAIALSWSFIDRGLAAEGAVVEIYHRDRLLATYRMPQPGRPAIHFDARGDLGVSRVEISSNGARMLASPCNRQRCVLAGAHRHAGDMIACVPNRILIVIRGSDAGRFDAIVE